MSTYHYTLNPEDKYVNPAPPIPPIRHKTKISIASADALLQVNLLECAKPVVLQTVNEVSTADYSSRRESSSCYNLPLHTSVGSPPNSEPRSRQSSIWATFDELRSVRSAGHASRVDFDFGFERPTTSAGRLVKTVDRVSLASAPGRPVSEPHEPVCEPATVGGDLRHVYDPIDFPGDNPQINECSSNMGLPSGNLFLSYPPQQHAATSELLGVLGKSRPSRNQVNDLASQFSLTLIGNNLANPVRLDQTATDHSSDLLETGSRSGRTGRLPDVPAGPGQERCHQTSSVYSSVRSSQVISPSLTFSTALTGYMSPIHLGQPSTPMIDEFEESFFDLKLDSFLAPCDEQPEDDNATPHATPSGFPGYNHPEVEYKSALTLRNLQSTTPKDSPCKKKSSHDLVSSWNDGLTAPETGLDDLLDELGYLGEVIV